MFQAFDVCSSVDSLLLQIFIQTYTTQVHGVVFSLKRIVSPKSSIFFTVLGQNNILANDNVVYWTDLVNKYVLAKICQSLKNRQKNRYFDHPFDPFFWPNHSKEVYKPTLFLLRNKLSSTQKCEENW